MVGKPIFNFLMFPRNGQHVPGLLLLVVAVDPPNWTHRGFFIPTRSRHKLSVLLYGIYEHIVRMCISTLLCLTIGFWI
jgi:hypothetical protein